MTTARLQSLWRYPVKSMEGEELATVEVTSSGLLGDRAYALVDAQNKVGTAKKKTSLLHFRARFLEPPEAAKRMPAVQITLPDGTPVTSGASGAEEMLSKALGDKVSLQVTAPPGLALEFAAGTLGGSYAAATEAPLSGAAPAGTFFDYAPVHLVTTATLARLREAYPQGQFEIRRFRPNFVVETPEAGFVENAWVGRTVALGDSVVLRVLIPCPRCVMTTLPQGDLPHDPGILRTATQLNRLDVGELGNLPCVGVYAEVVKPGLVRRGDPVRVGE